MSTQENSSVRAGLLAEARTWRQLAEKLGAADVLPDGHRGLCNVIDALPMQAIVVVEDRFYRHYLYKETPFQMDDYGVAGSRVLFCLFMALEAEDEARALAPSRRTR